MSMRRVIFGLVICLSIAVFVGQTLSQTRRPGRTRETPDWNLRKNMTSEQIHREQQKRIQQWQMQNKKRIEQLEKRTRSESAKRADESMKQALRATERQWKVIKPRLDKVEYLSKQARVSITPHSYRRSRSSGGNPNNAGAGGSAGSGANINEKTETSKPNNRQPVTKIEEGWKWSRPWESKALGELTEGERICEELLELLEDKNSRPEEIEQKMEALRKIRQEAKKQLAKAQQELREVLTFRQEATLVLMLFLY